MKPAPIALFVYNRPDHTAKVLDSLKKNDLSQESELYVFADGPKKDVTEDGMRKIKQVRNLINNIQGFKSLTVVESELNKGLSTSIINGIQMVLEQHDRIIVFEDDIVAHPKFLTFCNHSLIQYEYAENVFAVSGYIFPLKGNLPPTFFLRAGAVWGWGCWKRSWEKFSFDSEMLLEKILMQNQVKEFDFGNKYHFYELLKNHHEGKVSSWDVCWYASIFILNGLTCYPSKSLTANIGMDGSGTHYSKGKPRGISPVNFSITPYEVEQILNHRPEKTEVNQAAQKAFGDYIYSMSKVRVVDKIKNAIRRYGRIN